MKGFKIAIVARQFSFSKRWIEYCEEKSIPYKIVNCYESDIMSQLASVDALLWHWNHALPQDVLIARNVIYAAESMGLRVFPDTATCWSFDDKLAQKYLLESVGAPLVPAYVFFDSPSATNWIDQTSFPKVFKLRKGAGSKNVRLVRDAREARALVKQAFGEGFKPMGKFVRDMVEVQKRRSWVERLALIRKIKRVPTVLLKVHRINKQMGRECGYVYFQDFIPDNKFDTRITVIAGRYAFGFTRNVRENDFRASGSGSIDYNLDRINLNCVSIAFKVAKKLGAQSIAFDFVADAAGKPWITEISYCYLDTAVYRCAGHWDQQLRWHQGHLWPQDLILDDILQQLQQARQ